MRRFFRLLARVFGLVLVLLAFVVMGGGAALWLTLVPERGDVRIPGLSGPVDITVDQDGIPRIRAATMLDAAAALGYVHARSRLFQMELMRRAASGRLSELAGPVTLRLDRQARILGFRRHAEADLPGLPAETRAMLDAYARGVNAWIGARGRFAAPEFVPLGAPEPWTPVDSLLWGETLGLWLSGNWQTELARAGLAGHLPQAEIDELRPPDHEAGKPDARADAPEPALAAEFADPPHFPDPFTLPSQASNGWAVDGRHTASGAPLLAGDPHLALGFPSLWFLARIDTREGVLAGATAPGVPFLVIGRNSHIAWTFTTTGADTQDLFEETVLQDGTYATPDGPMPFTVHQERIKVRGGNDVVLQARETRHGPVISDLDQPNRTEIRGVPRPPVLAVQMMNLAPGNAAAAGLLALNRAGSVAEAGRAGELITAPVQNLLVADRDGIGMFTTGRVPIRRAGDGGAPVAGADGGHDWVGFASGEQLPHEVAPASGRLVNANERVAPADFPVFMGRDWPGDWRARRIRQMLDGAAKLTAADFALMQVDVVSTFAQQLLPALIGLDLPDGPAASAAKLLRGWDGRMAMDAPQPVIFNAWMQRFYLDLLTRAGIADRWRGPWMEFIAFVLTGRGAHWCGGDCRPQLRDSLVAAVQALTPVLGPDPAAWRWGEVHRAVFSHPVLGPMRFIGRLVTTRLPQPGDESTVFVGGGAVGNFESRHGPEFRGVYDLANLDHSLFVMAPGQSGNPLSRHAWDFLRRWRDGGTVTLGPEPERVAERSRLVP